MNRSKYLAGYLKRKGYNTRYGGIGPCKFDPEPKNPLKKEDIEWADIIITARDKHKPILVNDYGVKNKKIIVNKIDQKDFNKKWTYPQLRKSIKPYLPLKK